jgi:hypothetical protein
VIDRCLETGLDTHLGYPKHGRKGHATGIARKPSKESRNYLFLTRELPEESWRLNALKEKDCPIPLLLKTAISQVMLCVVVLMVIRMRYVETNAMGFTRAIGQMFIMGLSTPQVW